MSWSSRVGRRLNAKTSVPTRVVPHSLTRPYSKATERITARSARIPFRLPVDTRRWRIVIRNANHRTGFTYPGRVRIHTIAVGGQRHDGAGAPTSAFASRKGFRKGRRIIASDVVVANMRHPWASDWQTTPLTADTGYLLAYGYETNGQEVQISMGAGWRTTGTPQNAALVEDPTAEATLRQPFDVRIEYESSHTTPHDVVIGDSISAGSHATMPVLEAPAALAGHRTGRAIRLATYGGAGFVEWTSPTGGAPNTLRWQDVTKPGTAARVIVGLGHNDISVGASLEDLKERLTALIPLIRRRVSTHIVVCTITPRRAWVGTPKEVIRAAFNDWIRSHPPGVTEVADTARVVEDEAGSAPRDDYAAHDGFHYTTHGSAALASAIPGVG